MDGPRIAVIADAHFHDIDVPFGAGGPSVRRLAETARSTRVFNESAAALRHALDGIAARGIRLVVLLGDYSDDGQRPTLAALSRLLDEYRARGLRFLATPGNHDAYGAAGRHRSKRFLCEGGYRVVTSDPTCRDPEAQAVEVDPAMACLGLRDSLRATPGLGYCRDPADLHWESPFGKAALDARTYGPLGLVDASYLVEPALGLWLLMIDANVYPPDPAGHGDSTDAGWAAMGQHKGFVLDWIGDVAARAARLGKQLLAFSHYPLFGPLAATVQAERSLLGPHGLVARVPPPEAAHWGIAAGLRVHFSGHLHVNETNRLRRGGFLVNVSVPSLVAWPAAYKIVTPFPDRVDVETVSICDMVVPSRIQHAYRAEAALTGSAAAPLLQSQTYGAFLWAHLGHLVTRRFLRRDWPRDLAEAVRDSGSTAGLEDWYRLRMGGDLTRDRLSPARSKALEQAGAALGAGGRQQDLFHLLATAAAPALPSRDFSIDLGTGAVVASRRK